MNLLHLKVSGKLETNLFEVIALEAAFLEQTYLIHAI